MSLPPARNRKGPSSDEIGKGGGEDDPAATERATTPSGLSPPPPPQQQRRLRLPNPRFSDCTYSSIPGRGNSEAPDVPGASGKKRASASTPSSPLDEQRRQRRQQQQRQRELPDAAPAKESEPARTSHPWNLRRRRPAEGADDLAEFRTSARTLPSLRLAPDSANPKSARKPRPLFSFALSREEIEADFLKISGTKPCPRPKKKRPYSVQKILHTAFPGNFVSNYYC